MKGKKLFWVFVLLISLLAFWYGAREDNLVSRVVYPPSPTPVPDDRAGLGEAVRVDGMDLSLIKAWRIMRPNAEQDLGILEVKFAGTSECNDAGEKNVSEWLCVFQRGNFQLIDSEGNRQLVSDPAMKYLPGMKYVQLAPTRELIRMTSEQGQLYFLLDKNVNDFTLVYASLTRGEGAKLKVEPQVYSWEDAVRNISTTPQPKYGIIDSNL